MIRTRKEQPVEEQLGYQGIEFAEPPKGLLMAPSHRVVAHMDEPESLEAAVAELGAEGYDRHDIFVLCGHEGAERLDVSGRHHGLHGRIYRLVERALDTHAVLVETEKHLNNGGLLVSVPAHEENRAEISRVLREHGGHDIYYFGLNSFMRLGA